MKKNLFIGICLVLSTFLYAQENMQIYSKSVGNVTLYLLSDGQQLAKTQILLDTPQELLDKYAPEGVFPNAINAFLLKDGDEYVLFDAGLGKKLMTNLGALGIEPEEIKIVFLTHMHGDHVGGLMKEDSITFPNATVYVSQKEYDYWLPNENSPAKKAIDLYGKKMKTFEPLPLSEVQLGSCSMITIQAYGHTPGHTAFLINSEGENLLIWGDLTHAMVFQMPHPEIAVTYDVSPEDAVKARLEILDFVTKHKIPVVGMHISFPAMGTITPDSENGYVFQPL